MKTLKERIWEMIDEKNHVSFAELAKLEGFEGNLECSAENQRGAKFLLWRRISQEALDIINQLQEDNLIKMEKCDKLIYFID